MRKTLAWLVILSLLLPGCASRNVAPIGADGQAFKPESDERALWAKAEKEEEALLKKAKVYDDPMLDDTWARSASGSRRTTCATPAAPASSSASYAIPR